MKIKMTLPITLVLILITTFVFAAPGDETLFSQAQTQSLLGKEAVVKDTAFDGQQLYILFQTGVYVQTPGSGQEPTLLCPLFAQEREGDLNYNTFDEAKGALGEEARWLMHHLFIWQGNVYGLNQLTGEAFMINKERGEVDKTQPLQLNWVPPVVSESDNGKIAYKVQETVGNQLLILSTTSYLIEYPKDELLSIDLATGSQTTYPVDHVKRAFGYDEGQLLLVIHDEENDYDPNTNQPINPKVMVFTLADQSLAPFGELLAPYNCGVAYNPGEKAVYYTSSNKIYKTGQGQQEEMGYINIQQGDLRGRGWVTDGQYYIGEDLQGLVVKNIDPQQQTGQNLRIYGGREPSPSFMAKYPDVPVVMTGREEEKYLTWDELARAIQTGAAMSDVYTIFSNVMEFRPVMKKEYAYPLAQNDTIMQQIHAMYPYMQKALTHEGVAFGIPLEPRAIIMFGFHPQNWGESGLPPEEMPTTYEEFMNFYQRWQQGLQHQYPDYAFFEGPCTQNDLIWRIVEDYISYCQREGSGINFDTPLFRRLLERVWELDMPRDLDEFDRMGIMDTIRDKKPLFLWHGNNRDGHSKPLILALEEGKIPTVRVVMDIVFVNPLSENKQMAMAYLEEMMSTYSPKEQLYFYPSANHPVKSDEANEGLTALEEELLRLEQLLNTAEEAEKAPLNEQMQILTRQITEQAGEGYWEMSPDDVKEFEWLLPTLYISEKNVTYTPKEDDNINRLVDDYINNAISLDQLIQEADRRIEMMELESQ